MKEMGKAISSLYTAVLGSKSLDAIFSCSSIADAHNALRNKGLSLENFQDMAVLVRKRPPLISKICNLQRLVHEVTKGRDLPNVANNNNFLLVFTPFSKHAEIEHPSGTILEFDYHICIVNDIWHL